MHLTLRPFQQLSLAELYALLALRSRIFVVEQQCPYLDPDGGNDFRALHLLLQDQDTLAAYARVLPPDNGLPAIGRVVVAPEYRGRQLARHIMQAAIEACRRQWPHSAINLQAQTYLQAFYQSLGFAPVSEPYLEDGIPHINMRLEAV